MLLLNGASGNLKQDVDNLVVTKQELGCFIL